jgi:hypothetical protein
MKLASYALVLLPLAATAILAASCSSGDDSGGYETPDAASGVDSAAPPTPKDSGTPSKPKDSGSNGGKDANAAPDANESPDANGNGDDGGDDSSPPADGGMDDTWTPTDGESADAGWVDMTLPDGAPNTHACDDMPGVACGWSTMNNGLGYTCRCANPTWADPWGCEAPDSGAPETCPPPSDGGGDSATEMDSSSGTDSGHVVDAGGEDASDAGAIKDAQGNVDAAWVDMDFPDGAANPHACDNDPGAPCGWSMANNGAGYTCRCVNPTWADPWGCEPPDSGIPAACP